MEFNQFDEQKEQLLKNGVAVPEYYFFIDNDAIYTANDIAEIFQRDPKRVRGWFTVGLKKQGIIRSIDPTRHKVTGLELKKWLYKKDVEKLSKDLNFQSYY